MDEPDSEISNIAPNPSTEETMMDMPMEEELSTLQFEQPANDPSIDISAVDVVPDDVGDGLFVRSQEETEVAGAEDGPDRSPSEETKGSDHEAAVGTDVDAVPTDNDAAAENDMDVKCGEVATRDDTALKDVEITVSDAVDLKVAMDNEGANIEVDDVVDGKDDEVAEDDEVAGADDVDLKTDDVVVTEADDALERKVAMDDEVGKKVEVDDCEEVAVNMEVDAKVSGDDIAVEDSSMEVTMVSAKVEADDGAKMNMAVGNPESVDAKIVVDDAVEVKVLENDAVSVKTPEDETVDTKRPDDSVVKTNIPIGDEASTKVFTEYMVETVIPTDDAVHMKISEEDAVNAETLMDAVVETTISENDVVGSKIPKDAKVDIKTPMDGVVDAKISDNDAVDTKLSENDAVDTKAPMDEAVDTKILEDDAVDANIPTDDPVGDKIPTNDAVDANISEDNMADAKTPKDNTFDTSKVSAKKGVKSRKKLAKEASDDTRILDDAVDTNISDDDMADAKLPKGNASGSSKASAKKGAKSRKKPAKKASDEKPVEEEAEEMEVDTDVPAKSAGKRGSKIRKQVATKDPAVVAGEGKKKKDKAGPAKVSGSSETGAGKKRSRARSSEGGKMKAATKEEEESLCFICFDGGDLVVCDHRGCPKVYHPSCVNRDDAYFQAKGQWSCGWHICSKCEKSARHMCYTCTYSLCKGCLNKSGYVHVRGNKGFCEDCMKIVMLMETNKHEDETTVGLDFDDKTSWLYLFKDYWVELKEKLSLTLEELIRARTPSKGSKVASKHVKALDNVEDASDDQGGSSSSSPVSRKASASSNKKLRKRLKKTTKKDDSVKEVEVEGTSSSDDPEWASKELLEFVAHMRDGDMSPLPQFDVQALLFQYIRENNLRDSRNRAQIKCDSRLLSLFGKSRVGHLEMLKLFESHFLLKEASPLVTDENQGGVVDPDPGVMEGNSDSTTKVTSYMKKKSRRKSGEKQSAHLDDFAAIDVHNINFLYLRRNLVEELLDEIDTFSDNVLGSFVRIRISGLGQKQDLYRLVQIVGTGKAAKMYKTGRTTTDIKLEILNLDKREYITIDIISNQEFTEEECTRLRQSVKCGLIKRLTVGEVLEKAMALQNVRVNDWFESEKSRLGNLRDRASETGRKKDLRECVEKLQLLSTPEERVRKLNEIPDVHSDPRMDPDYESPEEDDLSFKKQDVYGRPQRSMFKTRDGLSPRNAASPSLKTFDTRDSNRTAPNEGHQNQMKFSESFNPNTNTVTAATGVMSNSSVIKPPQSSTVPQTISLPPSTPSETEKIWNYQDPSNKIQGPFSMAQLRKWNTSNFFPVTLRIWRSSEKQEDSILLTDALAGKFQKDLPRQEPPQPRHVPQPLNTAPTMDSRAPISPGVPSPNTFSRNSSHYSPYQGRDDRGGNNGRWTNNRGRQSNFDSNQPRRYQYNDRGQQRHNPYQRQQPEHGGPNRYGNNFVGPPAPNQVSAPNQAANNNIDWNGIQGALNKILPSASSSAPPVQTDGTTGLESISKSVSGVPSVSGSSVPAPVPIQQGWGPGPTMMYGSAMQGWPGVMNMGWAPQANMNMVWAPTGQAVPNQGWVNPNPNGSWVGPVAGNMNPNQGWAPPAQVAASGVGTAGNPAVTNPNGANAQL